MFKTFSAYNQNGNIVKFSVCVDCQGCMFTARKAAMAECDRQGWTIRRMEVL